MESFQIHNEKIVSILFIVPCDIFITCSRLFVPFHNVGHVFTVAQKEFFMLQAQNQFIRNKNNYFANISLLQKSYLFTVIILGLSRAMGDIQMYESIKVNTEFSDNNRSINCILIAIWLYTIQCMYTMLKLVHFHTVPVYVALMLMFVTINLIIWQITC